jgi:hypothetical protein
MHICSFCSGALSLLLKTYHCKFVGHCGSILLVVSHTLRALQALLEQFPQSWICEVVAAFIVLDPSRLVSFGNIAEWNLPTVTNHRKHVTRHCCYVYCCATWNVAVRAYLLNSTAPKVCRCQWSPFWAFSQKWTSSASSIHAFCLSCFDW